MEEGGESSFSEPISSHVRESVHVCLFWTQNITA